MIKLNALLDIEQVSQLTGLPAATLRNWEKRYGFPSPRRSTGGHRLFGVEDVDKIREVAALSNQGLKVSDAIGQVLSGTTGPTFVLDQQPIVDTLQESLNKVLRSLYLYDINGAEDTMSRIGLRLKETDLLELVYPALLRQVGEDWENSRINIAQEHFATNYFRTQLLNYFQVGRAAKVGPKVLLATLPGERHEGGLLILAAYLMLLGWQVVYLGADLPLEDLHQATDTICPDLVCISVVREDILLENLKSLEDMSQIVAVGGPGCVGLTGEKSLDSERVFVVRGALPSTVNQLEVLMQASSKTLKKCA